MKKLVYRIVVVLCLLPSFGQQLLNPFWFSAGGGGGGSIAYVGISGTATGSGTTISVSRTCTAGNTLIAIPTWEDTSVDVTIADGSNTYTARTEVDHSGTTANGQMFYAKNITGGSLTITATFDASVPFSSFYVVEVSGLSTSAPFDVEPTGGGASGTSTAPNSGNFTTTAANEFLITCIKNYGGLTVTPQAGWTEITDSASSNGTEIQYRIVSSTGTYAGSGTITSEQWVCVAAGFK